MLAREQAFEDFARLAMAQLLQRRLEVVQQLARFLRGRPAFEQAFHMGRMEKIPSTLRGERRKCHFGRDDRKPL